MNTYSPTTGLRLRRRDLIALIPADVAKRIQASGLDPAKVDWYGGRLAQPSSRTEFGRTPEALRDELRLQARLHRRHRHLRRALAPTS